MRGRSLGAFAARTKKRSLREPGRRSLRERGQTISLYKNISAAQFFIDSRDRLNSENYNLGCNPLQPRL